MTLYVDDDWAEDRHASAQLTEDPGDPASGAVVRCWDNGPKPLRPHTRLGLPEELQEHATSPAGLNEGLSPGHATRAA